MELPLPSKRSNPTRYHVPGASIVYQAFINRGAYYRTTQNIVNGLIATLDRLASPATLPSDSLSTNVALDSTHEMIQSFDIQPEFAYLYHTFGWIEHMVQGAHDVRNTLGNHVEFIMQIYDNDVHIGTAEILVTQP